MLMLVFSKDGCTALMLASRSGHQKCVAMLLERGANVDTQGTVSYDCRVCVSTCFS